MVKNRHTLLLCGCTCASIGNCPVMIGCFCSYLCCPLPEDLPPQTLCPCHYMIIYNTMSFLQKTILLINLSVTQQWDATVHQYFAGQFDLLFAHSWAPLALVLRGCAMLLLVCGTQGLAVLGQVCCHQLLLLSVTIASLCLKTILLIPCFPLT